MTPVASTMTLERVVGGLSLIVAPALLLLGDLIDSRPSEAGELASVAHSPGRHQAWALVGLLAVVLLVPATLTLFRLARPRRPLMAWLGGSLAIVGAVGLAAHFALNLATVEMARSGADTQMQALFDRIEGNAAVAAVILLGIAGTYFGQVVLTLGLWRARLAPVWVPALLALALPVSAAATSPIASDPIFLVALGWVGLIVLRMPRGVWDRPAGFISEARVDVSNKVDAALR
jgi:hypothetical protein